MSAFVGISYENQKYMEYRNVCVILFSVPLLDQTFVLLAKKALERILYAFCDTVSTVWGQSIPHALACCRYSSVQRRRFQIASNK
jgi:hypothetical protein